MLLEYIKNKQKYAIIKHIALDGENWGLVFLETALEQKPNGDNEW